MRARARWRLLGLAAGLGLGLVALSAAAAAIAEAQQRIDPEQLEQLDEERKRRQRLKAVGDVRSRISRYLEAAQKRADEGNTDEARALLERLNPARLTPMERAYVFRNIAYRAYGEGDYDRALGYFQKVLDEKIMRLRDDNQIRYYIAKIQVTRTEWEEVVAAVHEYLRYSVDPDPESYYLLGLSHFQLQSFDEAIAWAEKAVDHSPEPEENWLKLLAALYAQSEDYASAAPVLEELVVRFPKKDYWVQLSLIYGARENYQRSLAAQQVAYLQGFLTEDKELRRLVRGYLFRELPYPAAEVLERGLEAGTVEPDADAYELLANSWIQAREYERSLPALRTAAELSENGNLYVRLGQVYLQREQWEQAAVELQRALAKGGLRAPGSAQLLLGIAHYNAGLPGKARSHFLLARRYEKTRSAAEGWIGHVDRESGAENVLVARDDSAELPAVSAGPPGASP